ncbi:Na+/H+ antiporter NhaA [Actinoplanes sp. NPDC089786]|uniref:glycosyltransferase n=1 Tax=Actinoplanes sp. NPDC089786 TaxID=3155185 RepID=UPI003413FEEA
MSASPKSSFRLLSRGSWPEARRVGDVLRTETVGGVLLLVAAVLAIVWANSPWGEAYRSLGAVRVGPSAWHLDLSLATWAADGLLAIFFFVAGLELKREFVAGDLRDVRRAAPGEPGVPAVLGLPIPMYVPTRAFPWPGQQFAPSLPRLFNRATFAGMKAPAVMFGRTVDRWRAGLGLPRRRGRHDPLRSPDGGRATVLHGISPSVLPRPDDWPAAAWMTGYWFLDSSAGDSSLAPQVRELLVADPAPVYVGFGSMAGPDPAAATGVVLEALRLAGVRAVIGTGWGGLPETAAQGHVFASELPHDVVFPRCSVIVHHGGAGTTAAAARAGRSQVICPFVADQPFWGRRMQHLGVAPAPIDQRRLTAESLAAAIRRALTPSMAGTAGRIGERIRSEDGITTAATALEDIVIRSGR